MSKISRRDALKYSGMLAVGAATVTLPALANQAASALVLPSEMVREIALFKSLIADYERAAEKSCEAMDAAGSVYFEAERRFPARPKPIAGHNAHGLPFGEDDINRMMDGQKPVFGDHNPARFEAARQNLLQLFRDHEAQCQAILEEMGWPELDRMERAAATVAENAMKKIIRTPAKTLGGIQMKLRFAVEIEAMEEEIADPTSDLAVPKLIVAALRDVEQISAAA